MTVSVRTLFFLAAIQLTAAIAAAQAPPATSFDALGKRLQIGDRVWVTDVSGREIRGTLEKLSSDGLVLVGPGPVRLTAGDIARISAHEHDSIKNGALIGLGIGAGLASAWCIGAIADDSGDIDAKVECGEGFTVFPALSALIGMGIDGVIPGKRRVVYEAATTVKVTPLISTRGKGLAVRITF